jgi:ribonuclease J
VTTAACGLRVRIHRGAQAIGGNCVEVEAAGSRVVLDLGRPLEAGFADDVDLPPIAGLDGSDGGSLAGVVLSHAHLDHYGLIQKVAQSVPTFIGREAAAILDSAAFFSPSGVRLRPTGFLGNRRELQVGPFSITPYLVDHSAYDAYALLVEAGGRRLFYSGDFRAHGRKAGLFKRLCEDPPPAVDALLLEGTHIGRDDQEACGLDESEVELRMADLFCSTTGLVAVFSSTQNIDRLVTVYRACKRAGRTLVIDLYTATVAAATGRESIPHVGFPGLRVYVPQRQRVLVKESAEFERIDLIRPSRIFLDEVAASPSDFVALIQGSTLPKLARAGCLAGGAGIWSLWSGYLAQPSGRRVKRELEALGIPLVQLHASGHARISDLQALADALQPARIVPMHSAAPERFPAFFTRVERHADGEWWSI